MTTVTDTGQPIEDRLVAALRARAELVRPEDLTHSLPATRPARRPLWHAAAAAAGIAAAAAMAIPLTQRGHDGGEPAPATLPGNAGRSFPADVDGDGDSDLVSLTEAGVLTIDRGADGASQVEVPAGSWLLGAARFAGGGVIGPNEQAHVVVAVPAADDTWRLRVVGPEGQDFTSFLEPSAPRIAEFTTAWVAGGVLYTGQWDESGSAVQVRVDTSRYLAGIDSYVTRHVGLLCWDRATQPYPRACASPGQFGPEVGPAGDLPSLFPAQELHYLVPGDPEWTQGMLHVRLEKTAAGTELQVRIGGSSEVWRTDVGGADPLVVKAGTTAGQVMVVYGNGDGLAVELYVISGDGLVRVPIDPRVPLMSGIPRGADQEYAFWVAADGTLYSRRTAGAQQYDVWRWVLDTQAEVRLRAESLGAVCLDLQTDPVRYGRC